MSLFSFGSSKHSTFHARVTIHELDNVPLLQGAFQVKWKVGNAHSLPAGVQLAFTSQKETTAREGSGEKGKGKEGEHHAHHHHHHGGTSSHASPKHQRGSPSHQSQQIPSGDLPNDLLSTTEKRKSRKERQFASDPGGPSTSSANMDTVAVNTEAKDSESAPSRPAMKKNTSQVGSFLSTEGSFSDVEPRPEDALRLLEPGGANKHPLIAPPRREEEPEEDWMSRSSGGASARSVPLVEEPSPATPVSTSSKQSGRFSRLFHGLNNNGSPGPSSPVPSRQNSGSGTPMLDTSDSIQQGSETAPQPSSPESTRSQVHGRDFAHPPSHSAHHSSRPQRKSSGLTPAHAGGKLSILTKNGRNQLKRVASPPISETIELAKATLSPSSAHFPLRRSRSQESTGKRNGKVEEAEQEQIDKIISGAGPDTPGLDLTRPRGLSIDSKESASRASVATADSGKPGPAKSGETQAADTASLASKSSSIEKAKGSKGKERARDSSTRSGNNAPGSTMNGAAQAFANGAAHTSSHVASAMGLDLEPKGDTEEVNVKDHCVKWERTFEVGIRMAIEKYKPDKDSSGSSSSLSLNGLGHEHGLSGSTEKGSQTPGSNGASGHNTPGSGSGGPGLRSKRSRGALRKDSEEEWMREKERRRELAEAWGILGKATLRLNVKQRIETDGSHHASSQAGALGFVELNLAEYAPWPPSSVQAQVLAPHRTHGSGTSTPRSRNRPMRRLETRRYLLRDSKSNARLKLTIELTHVAGIREYAVPSIKRGLPVNSLPGYVSASSLSKIGVSMRNTSGEYSDEEGPDQGEADRASFCSDSSKRSGPRKSEASSRNGSSPWTGSQCSPYGNLLLKAPETMLRSSIPAKNLRSTSGTNEKSSRSRTFAGGSFVERDPTSVVDMIFDQAKFQASMAVGSRSSFSESRSSLQLPDANEEESKPGSRDEGDRSSSRPSSNAGSRQASWRNFSFRSRKISDSGKGGKDGDSFLSPLQPPSNMQHQLGRRRSSSSVSALATSSISAAVGVGSDRSLSPGRNGLAPILTSSPDALSRATSRSSDVTETNSSLPPSIMAPPSSKKSGSASSAALGIPSIDISSPGGRTFSSFQTIPFGIQPDDSGDKADLSIESNASTSSIVEHRLPLRRHQSDPAIVEKGRKVPSLAITPVSPEAKEQQKSAQEGYGTRKSEPVKKKHLRGSKGIPPEQAHQRGYKGIGWQTSPFPSHLSRVASPPASIGRESSDSRRQSVDRLDLLKDPLHGLSRRSSSSAESCGSLQTVGLSLAPDSTLASLSAAAA